jgi:hypothetical protein
MARSLVVAAIVACFGLAAAESVSFDCSFNGQSLSTAGTISQKASVFAPATPSLNQPQFWQINLCTPTTFTACASTPASYVIMANEDSTSCVVGFNTPPATSPTFTALSPGIANIVFTGQVSVPGDHVANVTIQCDPSATTLQLQTPVNARMSPTNVVTYDIAVTSARVCTQMTNSPPTAAPTLPRRQPHRRRRLRPRHPTRAAPPPATGSAGTPEASDPSP